MDNKELSAAAPSAPRSPAEGLPVIDRSMLLSVQDEAALAGVLLPGEQCVLSSRPHMIVWLRPAIRLFAACVALIWLIVGQEHPVIAGHHHAVALASTPIGRIGLAVVGAFALVQLVQVGKALSYFFGFRVVATNRRVFVVRSVLNSSIRPLGNSGMARSSLTQSLIGRIFQYGTIRTGEGTLRDMRCPVALWRSLEAVAHGVENGTWTPAIRQTIIP